MRRFAKRLLTGVLSGAMALSLFPVFGFGSYEAKAAEISFTGLSWEALPGDGYCWIDSIWADLEEGNGMDCKVTSVTVPKEYKDYVWVEEAGDQDGDGLPDGFNVNAYSERDEVGEITQSGADVKQDAPGKTIPLTLTYTAEDGTKGTTEFDVIIKDTIYEVYSYSSVGTAKYIPGMTDMLSLVTNKRSVSWDSFDQSYRMDSEIMNGVSYSFVPYDPNNDWGTVTVNGASAEVKIRDVKEGETFEEAFMIGGFAGDIVATYNGEEIFRGERGFGVAMQTVGFTPQHLVGIETLPIGATEIISPKLRYYDYHTARDGNDIDDANYRIENYDPGVFDVKKNDDGTFTLMRKSLRGSGFDIVGEYVNDDGEPDSYITWMNANELKAEGVGVIREEDDIFEIFDDTVSRVYSFDDTAYGDILANGYELKWVVGRNQWGIIGEEITEPFEDGWTVAADGKSISIDGRALAKYFDIQNGDGGRWMSGDPVFGIYVYATYPGMEPILLDTAPLSYNLVIEEYNELVNANPEWYRVEDIMPGDVLYLDNYYYYVENDANPKGAYIPFDINVKSVVRYENNAVVRDRVCPIEYKVINGRPAITTISRLPEGADEWDMFGDGRVDFTYYDASGTEKSGYLIIRVTDFSQEVSLDFLNTTGVATARADEYGNYHVDTLMGEKVALSAYVIVRKYDHNTGEVKVEYPDVSSFTFDAGQEDDGISIQVKEGVYVFSCELSDAWESRVHGDIVAKYMYNWAQDEESDGLALNEARGFVDVGFTKDLEIAEGLDLSNLRTMKTIEWTPSIIRYDYSEDQGKYEQADRTAEYRYGFVYDPDDVSVTCNGEEVLNKFVSGPFTITSKTDKDVRLRFVKADYDPVNDVARYHGNREDVMAGGVKRDINHDDHVWVETVGIKAGFGKAGRIVRVCDVGRETETEDVPAVKSITLDKTVFPYTGSEPEIKVTVRDVEGNVIDPIHYEVDAQKGKNAGTYKVVVTFAGYKYEGTKTLTYTIKKPTLKYRAYVQKKNWMTFQTATISNKPVTGTKGIAGTTDNLRMETIQMQLSGVGGEIRYRAYCQKKGWVGVGTATGGWATTANKNTSAGTKGESRRVEMIQLQAKGEVSTLYDLYYQAYSEKFGWLAWAGNNEKAGSAGYAYKLEAFRVQLVPKGAKFDKTSGSKMKKSFYDKTKDGANPK